MPRPKSSKLVRKQNDTGATMSESELKRTQERIKREEILANVYDRNGRLQAAETARIIAARYRKDIAEAK